MVIFLTDSFSFQKILGKEIGNPNYGYLYQVIYYVNHTK